jgi:hypothetical protein
MPGQGGVYSVDDAVREIGLISSVAVGVSKHDPVGAAGSAHLYAGSPEPGKEMASRAAIPRRCASHQALIHGLVIACLSGRIELQSDLGLEDRTTIKGDGTIEQSVRPGHQLPRGQPAASDGPVPRLCHDGNRQSGRAGY